MICDVLFIPLDEVQRHFQMNERQDIKIVAPSILTQILFNKLISTGKPLKPETPLIENRWEASSKTDPNRICESSDFGFPISSKVKGLFAISFANEKAEQQRHHHKEHTEIYYSEHKLTGVYRKLGDTSDSKFILNGGGLALFQPNVVHEIALSGLTVIIEMPALDNDRFT